MENRNKNSFFTIIKLDFYFIQRLLTCLVASYAKIVLKNKYMKLDVFLP